MGEKADIGFRQWLGALLRMAFFPVVLLWPAGTVWWPEAWAVSALYVAYALVTVVVLARNDPDLLRERMKASPAQEGQKGWDKAIMLAMLPAGMAVILVPGLDVVRYGWTEPLPVPVRVIGFVLHVPCMAAVLRVMLENSYLARVVKIDEERGHSVITTGPYAVVRHPMYAAVLVMMVATPMALGSTWGIVAALAMNALLVIRTALEDRTLHEELDGYPEYAQQTRYRLIPGVW